MKKQLIISLKMLGLMTILLGVIYPLIITGVAQLAFPSKANGSLIDIDGTLRGSKLIGQNMDTTIYFTPRPSATKYNTLPSGASNLGLTNRKLHNMVIDRKLTFIRNNKLALDTHIPSDVLFASASGLDPHISPIAAKMQVERIAYARNFTEKQKDLLNVLIDELTETPQFGVLGCTRVNVFMLNLELDKLR
ncbi:potassium-transporting ATPase subunit KdpC [Dysgonomonas sp. Marseille-P4677]|uniref:potassium-transporting ATPase subunit KdpC n=1 Tax=Dysgonomonas sp. Marseille-P4677 TaxID=2364790 RepID=UPI001913651F|nr:potassium-transporting ATPase subunit KdpC [Dysgonomonas sp. Marseille-P4677]MBK5722238.1 potassium-transporting ATPase subunit KdpC [Dysgonomonas sp. Marseille-P4677]